MGGHGTDSSGKSNLRKLMDAPGDEALVSMMNRMETQALRRIKNQMKARARYRALSGREQSILRIAESILNAPSP